MPQTRHKIPTGLNVEDTFIAYGSVRLTFRQLALVLIGAAVGYGGVWQAHAALPLPIRAGVALLPLVGALLLATLQPAGRSLEAWALTLLRYWLRPRLLLWRPVAVNHPSAVPHETTWADLLPTPHWAGERQAKQTGQQP